MSNKDIEKLVHCLNALKIIREMIPEVQKEFPGYNRIVREADKVLINNPEVVPDWYK